MVLESGFVRVRGARTHNLKDVDVDIPRDRLVVFSGISGSGKSSLAFGTLFAEAQRRYLESVSPYARRLFDQIGVPDVDSIEGLPPAVALQQQRGTPSARSSVGSVTTISNLLRMLYSRAGHYPPRQPLLYAEDFSPNTSQGACPTCHGLGRTWEVDAASLVPDDTLSIRDRAIAAWPPAWQGQNLRDILVTLGYDVDRPWRELRKKERDWILFTEETPTVPVYAGFTPKETRAAVRSKMEPSYMGTFTSARRHLLHSFATTESTLMKKRAARFMKVAACTACKGKRLKREALAVTFAGVDIGELSALPLAQVADLLRRADGERGLSEEKRIAAERLTADAIQRIATLSGLGLDYLSLDRSTQTLSPGELQRLRLATQIGSHLFGVVYVLDEPSAGLHPADTEALLDALTRLKRSGNSLFVVEHDLTLMRRADWLVDVGPGAGDHGGRVVYSGPPDGLAGAADSRTRPHFFGEEERPRRRPRSPSGWLRLGGVTRNNLRRLDVAFPLGCLTAVTGVSGSGKSSLVSQALMELVAERLGSSIDGGGTADGDLDAAASERLLEGRITEGASAIRRLVQVDQRPIGRTPRSNLATYTGLFDAVRKLFASTPAAKKRRYGAGRFSFNLPQGRCSTCAGEGFVSVELLFMPSVYAPCSACRGARYDEATLAIRWRGKNVAEVLALRVDEACALFADEPAVLRPLQVLQELGLGYLRLGQPATELSGGEAQRIKLATELGRSQRSATLYVLDEPTTGLHPVDVDRLFRELDGLVEAGNTVIVVEHEMRIVARSDWVIDVGPGAGGDGGRIVAAGTPEVVARTPASRTAPYLLAELEGAGAADPSALSA